MAAGVVSRRVIFSALFQPSPTPALSDALAPAAMSAAMSTVLTAGGCCRCLLCRSGCRFLYPVLLCRVLLYPVLRCRVLRCRVGYKCRATPGWAPVWLGAETVHMYREIGGAGERLPATLAHMRLIGRSLRPARHGPSARHGLSIRRSFSGWLGFRGFDPAPSVPSAANVPSAAEDKLGSGRLRCGLGCGGFGCGGLGCGGFDRCRAVELADGGCAGEHAAQLRPIVAAQRGEVFASAHHLQQWHQHGVGAVVAQIGCRAELVDHDPVFAVPGR